MDNANLGEDFSGESVIIIVLLLAILGLVFGLYYILYHLIGKIKHEQQRRPRIRMPVESTWPVEGFNTPVPPAGRYPRTTDSGAPISAESDQAAEERTQYGSILARNKSFGSPRAEWLQ